jgi:amino acid permease
MSELNPVRSAGSILSNVINNNANALENFALENDEDDFEEFLDVPLEEFLYHAKIQRELEKSPDYGEAAPTIPLWEIIRTKLLNKEPKVYNPDWETVKASRSNIEATKTHDSASAEKVIDGDSEKLTVSNQNFDMVSESIEKSRENANRMLRVASWGSVFYLITTDILGPTSAPYAIAQLGYVPGALLYFLFGICAAYCGVLLWKEYLLLDSIKYPLRNYGDVVGRIYGRYARYSIDFFQAVQLFCNVAVIILGNGQGLSQIAKGKGCYTILIFVWAIAGAIVGQIRTLAKFGFLANAAIWMNVFVIIATMACVAKYSPNFVAALGTTGQQPGPVITHVIVSGSGSDAFQKQLNACMNIVYSYGGALVFVEFMSEMKRPWDFWKGMAAAQMFIFTIYLVFAMVVYNYQGQYVINPANQGISEYGWQTATNVINLVSALIAAGLYGNVGIKCLYNSIFQRFFRWPALTSKFGRYIWTVFVCIYWAIAFVFAAAIPNFSSLVSLIGAVCILQFSYTFPFILQFGLDLQLGAMIGDGEYDPINKITHRVDTWRNWSRWARGYKQRWFANTAHFILFLASLATAGLGIYASSMSLKAAFKSGTTTSFTCKSPVA